MDLSRQQGIIDPSKLPSVTVIGAGATGSALILALARVGIGKVVVYDYDIIEEHNISNQNYSHADIGKHKATVIASTCKEFGCNVIPILKRVDKKIAKKMKGIVFVMVDTMSSRKEIIGELIKVPGVTGIIEPRMGASHAEIYSITRDTHDKWLKASNYGDEQTEVSACGTTISVWPTAQIVANLCVWLAINQTHRPEQGVKFATLLTLCPFGLN